MNDRDRLIELIADIQNDFEKWCVECAEDGHKDHQPLGEYLADKLLANGVIVPPCKVGDTVYCIDYILKIVEKCKVYGLQIVNGKIQLLVDNCECKFVTSIWYFTKEEAKKALAERSKK